MFPGNSNAFEISQKLGISKEIISKAKSFMNTNEINIETLLTNIHKDKERIEKEKEKIIENSKKIEFLKQSIENTNKDIEDQEKAIIREAKDKAKNILLDAKESANEIIKNIEKSSLKEANLQRNMLNRKINNLHEDDSKSNSKNKQTKNDKTKYTTPKINELKINDEVFIPKINQYGIVSSITNQDKVEIMLPLGKIYFNLNELELKNNPNNQKNNNTIPPSNRNQKKRDFAPLDISSEINVIGMNVLEACETIDKYLDTAFISSLSEVRIIHGKGSGKLREGIQAFLKKHPQVKSFRNGNYGEGEMGVTIVSLNK